MMTRLPWHQALVRLGRRRVQLLVTLFSVVASLVLTAVSFVLFEGQAQDLYAFFVPALVIPAVVAPVASGWVIDIALALDEAHRRAAEQASQLAAVLATATIGIAQVDSSGTLHIGNAPARALLGVAEEGRVDWGQLFVHAHERETLRAALGDGATLRDVRWTWRDEQGARRIVRVHLAPLGAAGATYKGSVIIIEDITEVTTLEQLVAQSKLIELASQIAGGMAHEFNNLLSIIRVSTAAMENSVAVPPSELRVIDEAVEQGRRLTRRLLAISRRDVHAPVVQPVLPLLYDVLALVRTTASPDVHLTCDATQVSGMAAIDREAVQLVLVSLLMNALDAVSDGGHIRISAREELEGSGRGWIIIGVHDDGRGMSAEVLARATDPFFTTKAAPLGVGLGLSIARETMQRHEGCLEIESRMGNGTDVMLWFPVAMAPLPVQATPMDDAGNDAADAGFDLLLVEDDAALRRATERLLRAQGHRVTSVDSAHTARQHLAGLDRMPHLIVSDVMMPGETGLDLVRDLRARGCGIPVLLISGYPAEQIEEELDAGRGVAFLAKPWATHELEASMRALVRGTSSSREA